MERRAGVFLVTVGLAMAARAQLATERAGTSQLLIAAAGSTQGLNGTFFKSDITVVNYRTTDQRVRFNWLPQGQPGGSVPPVEVVIPMGAGITSEDFVTEILHQSGLGSILVTAITPDGQFDISGKLHAASRIWSNQPGLSSGTVSQTFPVISLNEVNTPAALIIGQRRDDRYRLNVGIVNLNSSEQNFQITVHADNRVEVVGVTVPGLSMRQQAMIGPPATTVQLGIVNVSQGPQSASWVAYGSSVDNATGDSWSSLGYVVP